MTKKIEIKIPGSGMRIVIERCATGEIIDYRSDIDGLVDRLCFVNFRQWGLEDSARDPNLSPEDALHVLREIQRSNAERISLINRIDDYYLAAEPPPKGEQMYWCHTFGEMIDSLSIMYIREFKFRQRLFILAKESSEYAYAKRALSAIVKQISVCERAFIQNLQLFVSGRLRYLPYKRYKLYSGEKRHERKT